MNRTPYTYANKRKAKGTLLLSGKQKRKPTVANRVLDEVHLVEKEAVTKAMSILDEVDKLDGRLSHVWHLWEHRMDRLLTPNYSSHLKSMVSVFLCVLQIILILDFVHVSHGHIGNIKHFGVIMLPIYALFVLRLLVQLATLLFVVHRALYVENRHTVVLSSYEELNRFVPVLEHALPVVTYLLLLVTSVSIGCCHLNFSPDRAQEGLCKTFTLDAVQVIVGLYVTTQIIHHLLSLFNHTHHTSMPRRRWMATTAKKRRYEELGGDEDLGGDGVVDDICMLNDEVSSIWSWWKYRMNRILSANITQNLCNILDISLEGITTLLVIKAVHASHGNLGNVSNIAVLLVPLYVKFFTKALIQGVVIAYVFCNHFARENQLQFIRFLREPGQVQKTVEHVVPMLAQILFGCVTIAVGQCHLNPTLQKGQMICQVFSYQVVRSVVIVVGLLQLTHHIFSMYHYHRHSQKPERSDRSNVDEIELSSVSNSVM